MKLKTVVFTIALSAAGTAAGDGAHVHGEAQLRIAVEGDRLYAEFESPAANLVGFEHRPANTQQEALLERAGRTLAGADRFLVFRGARCRLLEADVEVPHGKGEGSETGEHASFRASYRFQCDNLARLDTVDVALFASFPGIHRIAVQWLTPERQGAVSLTARNNQVQLK